MDVEPVGPEVAENRETPTIEIFVQSINRALSKPWDPLEAQVGRAIHLPSEILIPEINALVDLYRKKGWKIYRDTTARGQRMPAVLMFAPPSTTIVGKKRPVEPVPEAPPTKVDLEFERHIYDLSVRWIGLEEAIRSRGFDVEKVDKVGSAFFITLGGPSVVKVMEQELLASDMSPISTMCACIEASLLKKEGVD